MSEQIEMNRDLNRRIEADPAKFFEIHDNNGSKLNNNESLTNGKNEKTVVKENNQNSCNKENQENEQKLKKDSKHKK